MTTEFTDLIATRLQAIEKLEKALLRTSNERRRAALVMEYCINQGLYGYDGHKDRYMCFAVSVVRNLYMTYCTEKHKPQDPEVTLRILKTKSYIHSLLKGYSTCASYLMQVMWNHPKLRDKYITMESIEINRYCFLFYLAFVATTLHKPCLTEAKQFQRDHNIALRHYHKQREKGY